MGAELEASSLGRKFGPRWLFRNLEFHARAGECLAITGPNGSGKSTLLKIVSGLMPPTEGSVSRPEKIGSAALDLALYGELTGAEHLEFAARLRGCEPGFELLERFGLQDAKDRQTKLYSSGMRARLKFCLALQHQPGLLILDEPTAALDEDGRRLVREAVADQAQRGPTIIATNDQRDLEWATHELRLG